MNKSCLLPGEKLLEFCWKKQPVVCIFENTAGQYFAGPVFDLGYDIDGDDNITQISLHFEWLVIVTLMLLPIENTPGEEKEFEKKLSPDLRSKKEMNALRRFNNITLKNDGIQGRIICEYTSEQGDRLRLTLSKSPLHVGHVMILGEKYDLRKP